jgi:hypothetical protein
MQIKTIKSLEQGVPLQPMSTSMPMTCAVLQRQKKSLSDAAHNTTSQKRRKLGAQPTLDLKQLIPRITLPHNEACLRKCCEETLHRICDEYTINSSISIFKTLDDMSKDPEESSSSITVLFFLCLDIDLQLKEMMMSVESDAMKRKLAGFFTKMRNEVIPVFLCDEKMEAEEFVRTCQETYLLA